MSNVVVAGQYSCQINANGTITIKATELDNLSTTATAPVKLELWLTTTPWNPDGKNTGYKIGEVPVGGDGTMSAGQKLLNIDQTVAYTKPPAGTYYTTLVVSEKTGLATDLNQGYFVDSSQPFNQLLTISSSGAASTTPIVTPTISITSESVRETDIANAGNMVFTLKLSQASLLTTTVHFTTGDETAVAGKDYEAVDQLVTFAPGVTSVKVYVPIHGNKVFEPARVFDVNLSDAVNGTLMDKNYDKSYAYGFIVDDDQGSLSLPTDNYANLEWNLYTTRTQQAWAKATGKGVTVAVLDNGIDSTNPDLTANTLTQLGRTTLTMTDGGAPVAKNDDHGTMVAGVIAAARDGKGVVGVAYDAKLVSLYSADILDQNLPTEIANAYTYAKNFDVLNDSWGYGNLLKSDTNWAFLDNANSPEFAPAFKALHDLAADGRDGLGTVVVQAAGNGYSYGDDTNLHNFQNSRYIITVAANDYQGDPSYYSTSGASILVSAPGGAGLAIYDGIFTTDRTGAAGQTTGNITTADGTSFSAPMVSGIVALMLQVNPNLGYRDVQQILAYTAHQTGFADTYATSNGASDWNGGGLRYLASWQDTGFGQVDALGAVRLAASWDSAPKTVANTVESITTQTVSQAIPDNDKQGVSSTISVASDMVVERVDVSVNITHPYIGDLQIALTSPTGTTSYLMYRPAAGALSAFGSSQSDVHFTFDTVLDWGESATGNWTLNVTDLATGASGSFTDWTLDLIGHAASKDDTYIYTDEFAALVKADPLRGILKDSDGGSNTINVSATGSDNYLDLSGATASTINGGKLTLAAGTTISNAYGGDGNDTIIANASGGTLRGMDGNDSLRGGAGRDLLDGGRGNDTLSGGDGTDTALYHHARADYVIVKTASAFKVQDLKGDDGADTLSSIERLQFSDSAIAYDTSSIAGQAYRLYQAAFDRAPDAAGLGYWIKAMDSGMALAQVAQNFIGSGEFKTLYGDNPGNTELLNHLYSNVLHRAPDAAGAAYWMDLLDQHKVDATGILVSFSESAENVAALVGVMQNGIVYTPYA